MKQTKEQCNDCNQFALYLRLVDFMVGLGIENVIVYDAKTGKVHEAPIFGMNGMNGMKTIQVTINQEFLDKPKKKKTHATKKTTKK